MIAFEQIVEMLSRQDPISQAPAKPGSAAVAMILAGEEQNLTLCFIERADRVGDPWSGHMALPGGRTAETDSDLQSTAEREVEEEVGVRLDSRWLIGRLPDLPILRYGSDTGLVLSIFVYYMGRTQAALVPNDEVADAFWIGLDYLWDRQNRTSFKAEYGGREMSFAAIPYRDNLIWGLTFRVLELFGQEIGVPFT